MVQTDVVEMQTCARGGVVVGFVVVHAGRASTIIRSRASSISFQKTRHTTYNHPASKINPFQDSNPPDPRIITIIPASPNTISTFPNRSLALDLDLKNKLLPSAAAAWWPPTYGHAVGLLRDISLAQPVPDPESEGVVVSVLLG